ncbi:hypothetical protein Lal_00033510 [Lupinus albus]|nr:hypothetical protein Lal_00033510 [Lupinus albus]
MYDLYAMEFNSGFCVIFVFYPELMLIVVSALQMQIEIDLQNQRLSLGRMDLVNPTNMDVSNIQHVSQGSSHQLNVEYKYGKKQLDGSSRNGTKHLHNHMELCIQKNIMTRDHDKGPSFLFPKASQGKQELGVGTYDAENMKRELANAIIMHNYPLSIVDHVGFRRYLATLYNTLNLSVLKGGNSPED